MRKQSQMLPAPGSVVVLAVMSAVAMAAIVTLTSTERAGRTASIEAELETISERAERIAAFKRNIHTIRLDAPETRAVPFAGFIASDGHLKAGRELVLVRNHVENAKLKILEVRRITQSVSVTRPSAMRMDLLLVRGRFVDDKEPVGDHVLPLDDGTADEATVDLLFAVGAPNDDKTPTVTTTPAHRSL